MRLDLMRSIFTTKYNGFLIYDKRIMSLSTLCLELASAVVLVVKLRTFVKFEEIFVYSLKN